VPHSPASERLNSSQKLFVDAVDRIARNLFRGAGKKLSAISEGMFEQIGILEIVQPAPQLPN
jgi:hypothetical protein